MNSRNLVTSLSQQLDTSCMDFPDGFEETQQLQVCLIWKLFQIYKKKFQRKQWEVEIFISTAKKSMRK